MQWVARIQHALEEGRFQLYYQVIAPSIGPVDKGERFEVLLRMVDEVGEIVAPDTFLPAAERYGIVDKLDRWVVTEVLDWFTKHPLQLENIAMCSLNVSGRSMSDDGFLEFLIAAIEDASVPATKLCFEITETAAIEHLDDTARFMSRLKEVGCCFALDDFGSGVSSFAYLRQLPADVLKIDGLFIQNLLNDPADAAITKSINEVAHTLGKQTVAEFVESEAILTAVREIGVDFVQGFAVGNPSQLSDLPLWGRTKPNC